MDFHVFIAATVLSQFCAKHDFVSVFPSHFAFHTLGVAFG